jgi:hypothetical protein
MLPAMTWTNAGGDAGPPQRHERAVHFLVALAAHYFINNRRARRRALFDVLDFVFGNGRRRVVVTFCLGRVSRDPCS